ncbi:unnamed protein product [Effrenium voratum]|uniref:Uncharacterized protein n=1 Tax=Effrenium voratum TaxID=2562239 RepID=A0AA36NE47_9DINO|nr:unnamed protein product [Effrenium voratum]
METTSSPSSDTSLPALLSSNYQGTEHLGVAGGLAAGVGIVLAIWLATIPKRLTARTAKGKLDMEEPEAKAEAEAEDEGRWALPVQETSAEQVTEGSAHPEGLASPALQLRELHQSRAGAMKPATETSVWSLPDFRRAEASPAWRLREFRVLDVEDGEEDLHRQDLTLAPDSPDAQHSAVQSFGNQASQEPPTQPADMNRASPAFQLRDLRVHLEADGEAVEEVPLTHPGRSGARPEISAFGARGVSPSPALQVNALSSARRENRELPTDAAHPPTGALPDTSRERSKTALRLSDLRSSLAAHRHSREELENCVAGFVRSDELLGCITQTEESQALLARRVADAIQDEAARPELDNDRQQVKRPYVLSVALKSLAQPDAEIAAAPSLYLET